MFTVFKRSWWRRNPSWPGGKEPHAGRRTIIRRNVATEEQARQMCREWNASTNPGKYSLKAEYERQ